MILTIYFFKLEIYNLAVQIFFVTKFSTMTKQMALFQLENAEKWSTIKKNTKVKLNLVCLKWMLKARIDFSFMKMNLNLDFHGHFVCYEKFASQQLVMLLCNKDIIVLINILFVYIFLPLLLLLPLFLLFLLAVHSFYYVNLILYILFPFFVCY